MLNNVSLMQRTDPAYFGRVMAVTMMAFGVNSIVPTRSGRPHRDAIGERATLGGLAVACGCVVLLGMAALRREGQSSRAAAGTVESELFTPGA